MFISNENRKVLKIENDARTKSISVKETYDGNIVVEGLPLASLYDLGYKLVHETFTITTTGEDGDRPRGATPLFENVYVAMMNSIEINGVVYENPTQQFWEDGYYSYGEPWIEGVGYNWDSYDFAIDFAPDDETWLWTKHPGVYEITIDAIVKYAEDPLDDGIAYIDFDDTTVNMNAAAGQTALIEMKNANKYINKIREAAEAGKMICFKNIHAIIPVSTEITKAEEAFNGVFNVNSYEWGEFHLSAVRGCGDLTTTRRVVTAYIDYTRNDPNSIYFKLG